MAGLKIVRISNDEDVFAAEETKLHTLSRRAISDMLELADRAEVASSAPPPASGVREAEANRPAPSKSGMVPAIPRAAAVPVIAHDEDDDSDLEPTVLHERAKPPSIPRQELVQQLMDAPPVIICPQTLPPPVAAASVAPAPRRELFLDRRMIAITIATFLATVVPALVLIHHLLQH